MTFVFLVAHLFLWPAWRVAAQAPTGGKNIPYTDVKPIFETLRSDLLPQDLREKTPREREAVWPEWVARRDADIHARIAGGDEDSIINFLTYIVLPGIGDTGDRIIWYQRQ